MLKPEPGMLSRGDRVIYGGERADFYGRVWRVRKAEGDMIECVRLIDDAREEVRLKRASLIKIRD